MVEQPFTLGVGAGDVTGRFDRIDAGPGGVQVVVDYKTGPPREEESLRKDLQVRAYAVALAASSTATRPRSSCTGSRPPRSVG